MANNTILIKRRLADSPLGTELPVLSNGELGFNEVNSVLYYGASAGTMAIAGSGAYVDRVTDQTIAGEKTFVNTITLSSITVSPDSIIDLGGNVITDLGAPVNDTDAATKKYVDDELNAVATNVNDVISVQLTALSASATLFNTLTSDVEVGAISASQVIPAYTTFQDFAEKLLYKIYNPTFTAPTASLALTPSGTQEVGTTGVTMTLTFNRGSITGKTVNGVWQPATFQDFRAGAATAYTFLGINNGASNSLLSADAVIQTGTNTFNGNVTYAQGPQPVNSKFQNFGSPLAAGTTSPNSTANITGARRHFWGVSNTGDSSAVIRTLGNSALGAVNGTTFTINIPSGATNVVFAYPATLRDVNSVIYVQGLNAQVKDIFGTPTTVNVEGANGFTAIAYKVYKYTPAEPFGAAATYNVTI